MISLNVLTVLEDSGHQVIINWFFTDLIEADANIRHRAHVLKECRTEPVPLLSQILQLPLKVNHSTLSVKVLKRKPWGLLGLIRRLSLLLAIFVIHIFHRLIFKFLGPALTELGTLNLGKHVRSSSRFQATWFELLVNLRTLILQAIVFPEAQEVLLCVTPDLATGSSADVLFNKTPISTK